MRYLRFLLFYLPLIFLPSIILPAVLVMTLIALLKVCEELGCLTVIGYFLILAPIVVCISVIVTHHFLAKKIIQRFSRTIEEKTTFTKLIIIHGFLLVLLSAMPIMVIAVYLNISNFSSNLFDIESNRYRDYVRLANFKSELSPKLPGETYPHLIITADANTREAGKYYFVLNNPLHCEAAATEESLLINNQGPDPEGWPEKPYLGDIYPVDLPAGKAPLKFEFILSKVDFHNPFYKTTKCRFKYEIAKMGRIRNENISSRLGGKPEYYENWEFYVTNRASFGEEWVTPEYRENDMATEKIPTIVDQKTEKFSYEGWKEITNKLCEIKLKYPTDWQTQISERDDSCFVSVLHPSIKGASILVHSYTTSESWEKFAAETSRKRPFTIVGIQGYTEPVSTSLYEKGFSDERVYFQKGDRLYQIIMNYNDQQTRKVYDGIIDSLSLITK